MNSQAFSEHAFNEILFLTSLYPYISTEVLRLQYFACNENLELCIEEISTKRNIDALWYIKSTDNKYYLSLLSSMNNSYPLKTIQDFDQCIDELRTYDVDLNKDSSQASSDEESDTDLPSSLSPPLPSSLTPPHLSSPISLSLNQQDKKKYILFIKNKLYQSNNVDLKAMEYFFDDDYLKILSFCDNDLDLAVLVCEQSLSYEASGGIVEEGRRREETEKSANMSLVRTAALGVLEEGERGDIKGLGEKDGRGEEFDLFTTLSLQFSDLPAQYIYSAVERSSGDYESASAILEVVRADLDESLARCFVVDDGEMRKKRRRRKKQEQLCVEFTGEGMGTTSRIETHTSQNYWDQKMMHERKGEEILDGGEEQCQKFDVRARDIAKDRCELALIEKEKIVELLNGMDSYSAEELVARVFDVERRDEILMYLSLNFSPLDTVALLCEQFDFVFPFLVLDDFRKSAQYVDDWSNFKRVIKKYIIQEILLLRENNLISSLPVTPPSLSTPPPESVSSLPPLSLSSPLEEIQEEAPVETWKSRIVGDIYPAAGKRGVNQIVIDKILTTPIDPIPPIFFSYQILANDRIAQEFLSSQESTYDRGLYTQLSQAKSALSSQIMTGATSQNIADINANNQRRSEMKYLMERCSQEKIRSAFLCFASKNYGSSPEGFLLAEIVRRESASQEARMKETKKKLFGVSEAKREERKGEERRGEKKKGGWEIVGKKGEDKQWGIGKSFTNKVALTNKFGSLTKEANEGEQARGGERRGEEKRGGEGRDPSKIQYLEFYKKNVSVLPIVQYNARDETRKQLISHIKNFISTVIHNAPPPVEEAWVPVDKKKAKNHNSSPPSPTSPLSPLLSSPDPTEMPLQLLPLEKLLVFDAHCLLAEECSQFLLVRLKTIYHILRYKIHKGELSSSGSLSLRIITGCGNNSVRNKAVLPSVCINLLSQLKVRHNSSQLGSILAYVEVYNSSLM